MVEAAGAVADLRVAVGARRPVFAGMQSAAIVALAEPPKRRRAVPYLRASAEQARGVAPRRVPYHQQGNPPLQGPCHAPSNWPSGGSGTARPATAARG